MTVQKSALEAASASRPDVVTAARKARRLLHRRALIGAAASTVPIPGVDWLVDAALLSRLLPRISEEFGLSPAQLDALDPLKREQVQKAVAMVGSVLIGKIVTRDMVMRLARVVGMRMSTKQVAKYVPLFGQLAAAGLGYAVLRYLGERHIQDCVRVVEEAELDLPGQLQRSHQAVARAQKDLPKAAAAPRRSWSRPERGPWARPR